MSKVYVILFLFLLFFLIHHQLIQPLQPTNLIPNQVHFIFGLSRDFGEKPFGLLNYLSVKSAHSYLNPRSITLHLIYEPSGKWWDRTLALSNVNVNRITKIENIYNITHPAHQSDILRLQILKKHGGIYMDTDVLLLNTFPTEWFTKDFVMAKEGDNGLGNALMLSKPNAKFIDIWLDEYKNYDPENYAPEWAKYSIHLPKTLWYFLHFMYLNHNRIQHPEMIHVLDEMRFFYPLWTQSDINKLYKENELDLPVSGQVALHAWSTIAYERFLKNLTLDEVMLKDTSFKKVIVDRILCS